MRVLNITFKEDGKLLLLKGDGNIQEIAEISESNGYVIKDLETHNGNIALEKYNSTPEETYKLIFRRAEGNEYETRMDVRNDILRIYTYDRNNNLSIPFQFDLKAKDIIPTKSSKSVAGNFFFSDNASYISNSHQNAHAVYVGDRTWHIVLVGSLDTNNLPTAEYYDYGIHLQAIASALGFSNYDYGIGSTSQLGTYRLWDRATGTEKTSLYGYFATLQPKQTAGGKKGYLLCRQYKIDSGVGATGGWPIRIFPAKSFIRAEFYMKAW